MKYNHDDSKNNQNDSKHPSTTKGLNNSKNGFFNNTGKFNPSDFSNSQNTTPISKRSSSHR